MDACHLKAKAHKSQHEATNGKGTLDITLHNGPSNRKYHGQSEAPAPKQEYFEPVGPFNVLEAPSGRHFALDACVQATVEFLGYHVVQGWENICVLGMLQQMSQHCRSNWRKRVSYSLKIILLDISWQSGNGRRFADVNEGRIELELWRMSGCKYLSSGTGS